MRRLSFSLLVLSSALALGCPPPRNENASNVNGPNTNRATSPTPGANYNRTLGADAPDKKNKAVLIAVSDDGKGNRQITIAPDPIKLDMSKGQKLRFIAFNNLELDVATVELDFGANEPFEGGKNFLIEDIDSGEADESKDSFRKAIKEGTYKYTVRVKLDDGTTFEKDPQVEISGGREGDAQQP